MKKYIYLILSNLLFFSISWPQDIQKSEIRSNFLNYKNNNILIGINIISQTNEIKSIDKAKILFKYNKGDSLKTLNYNFDSLLILQNENDILSLYSDIENIKKNAFLEDEKIGDLKDNSLLFFAIFDNREKTFINPELILPLKRKHNYTFLTFLKTEKDQYNYLRSYKSFKQDHYTLNISFKDNNIAEVPLKFSIILNGKEIINFNKEKLYIYKNQLSSSKKYSHKDLYKNFPLLDIGEIEIIKGNNTLEVNILDEFVLNHYTIKFYGF